MNALVELETRHVKAVQQYQEEVRLLKAELEKRGGVPKNLLAEVNRDGDEPTTKRPKLDGGGFSAAFPTLVGLKGVPGFGNKLGSGSGRPFEADTFGKPGQKLLKPSNHPGNNGNSSGAVGTTTGQWSLTTKPGKAQVSVDLKHQLAHDSAVCAVRFSNSGQSLATGCKKAAYMYSVISGERTGTFLIDSECYIRSVCFSPDDKQLVTGAEDKLVRVYEVATQALLRTLSGHTMEIFSVDWTSNGQYILSGSGDKSIRVWEADEGECVYTMVRPNKSEGPTGITCVAVSPDNQVAAAGSLDKSILFWGIQNGNFLGQLAGPMGHHDSVYAV
jgi:glucose repression regulatory protein TUP1